MTKEILTQSKLKEYIHYDKDLGSFSRKKTTSNRVNVLSDFNRTSKRYPVTTLFGKTYYLHRLAWLYVYGQFPKKHIDHIDGDCKNLKISNLREVEHFENHQNLGKRITNTSGYTGVSLDKRYNKWASNIWLKGKRYYLGMYENIEDARNAYINAKKDMHKVNPVLRIS